MNRYVTGQIIQTLREKQGYTQQQLAEQLFVSHKTISKWETGKGFPDITLLEPLAKALKVSVAELLSGTYIMNTNRSANMMRTQFYVCPVCGNVIYAAGEGAFSCCGITLPPLQPEEPDEAHALLLGSVDGERYVRMVHPMTKSHYISFFACVTSDRIIFTKLYPEQNPEVCLPMRGHGWLYAYCNQHGFFRIHV